MKGIYQSRPSLIKCRFPRDISILFAKYRELVPHNQLDLKALVLKTAISIDRSITHIST